MTKEIAGMMLRRLKRYSALLPCLVASLTLGVNGAAGEDLLLRLNAWQLDYKTTVALAEVGLATTIKVRNGDTLGQVIESRCGRSDEYYLRLLQERASQYPMIARPITFASRIAGDHDLRLPFCLILPKPQNVPIDDLATRNVYWASTDIQKRLIDVSTQIQERLASLTEIRREWNIGTFETWVNVPLSPEQKTGEAANKVMAALIPETVGGSATPPPTVVPVNKDIEVVSVLGLSDDKCPTHVMAPEKYPFDTMALLRALGSNQARGRSWSGGSAEIIIADTGLSEEAARLIYGALVDYGVRTAKERQPISEYPNKSHGAYVASVALGGLYFRRFAALMQQPIKVRPINLLKDKAGKLDSDQLLNVLDQGYNNRAIINLSITYNREIDGLKRVLEWRRNALFVAAAGNTPRPVTSEYPAALGGQYPNLIVVSSLNQDGEIETKQSTWSPAHVELTAPGCRIPVQEEGKEEVVHRSGTSLAAPLVSFAAAMLYKYDIGGPSEVKTRLLASADYDHRLRGKVKRNLKLNVVRAVAIASDVVETAAKNDTPIYGRVVEGGDLLLLCGGNQSMGRGTRSAPGPGNRSLLSLDVYEDNGSKHIFFLYRTHGADNLESDTCELDRRLSDHEIVTEEHDGGVRRSVKIGDLRKLLFAVD